MEQNNNFKRFNKIDKELFRQFAKDNDKTKFFNGLKSSLKRYKNFASRHTIQSTYRGILRKYFKLNNEELEPIDFTKEEKQRYYDICTKSIENQKVSVITFKMVKQLMKNPLLYLMLTSGRRISEIMYNDVEFIGNKVFVELNKKNDENLKQVHILGSVEKWKEIYQNLNKNLSLSYITAKTNLFVKSIVPDDFYKNTSHVCRAFYVRYIYKFQNPERKPLPLVIQKYLHHSVIRNAVYYQHVDLEEDFPKNFYDFDSSPVKNPSRPPLNINEKKNIDFGNLFFKSLLVLIFLRSLF